MKYLYSFIGLTISCCRTMPAIAQIVTPTTSFGDIGTVVRKTDSFSITGGSQRLNTLFHSFEDFSPETSDVIFQLDSSQSTVENVIGRVTGGTVSLINGELKLTGGNSPDLFLINPNGISFGPDTNLVLPGSFIASTAESVLFNDNLSFDTTNPVSAPILTISAPVGLGLSATAGNILVNNTGHNLSLLTGQEFIVGGTRPIGLQVNQNSTLGLVGGNISLNGGILSALNGQTSLSAVSSPAVVSLSASDQNWNINTDNLSLLGSITLTQQALIDAGSVGNVQLTAQDISIQDGSVIFQENNTSQAAGNIQLRATDKLEMMGVSPNLFSSGIVSDTQNDGQGGSILISARRVIGRDNGLGIRSYTFGDGQSGDVIIDARDINSRGAPNQYASIGLRTLGGGDTGELDIRTDRLTIQNSSFVSDTNDGTGNAGNIIINAAESIVVGPNTSSTSIIGSSAVGFEGDAGDVVITTPVLTVQGGALISSSTFGAGNAGSILINAEEQVLVTGEGLNIINRAIEPSRIGTAGVLLPGPVRARLGLPNNVVGRSGNVVVNTDVLSVTDGGELSVSHDDLGDGGSLQVNARQVVIKDGGSLLASTQSGTGGNIELNLDELLFMRNNALINVESSNVGDGGNIDIYAPIIAGFNNSDIVANAVGGNGGNISIRTRSMLGLKFRDLRTDESDITTASQFGINGTVEIDTFAVSPEDELGKLSESTVDIDGQVSTACADSESNQFIVSGRGGVPLDPSRRFESTQPWVDFRLSPNSDDEFVSPSRNVAEPTENEPVERDSTVDRNTHYSDDSSSQVPSLIEASRWTLTHDGQVELVTTLVTSNREEPDVECLGQREFDNTK